MTAMLTSIAYGRHTDPATHIVVGFGRPDFRDAQPRHKAVFLCVSFGHTVVMVGWAGSPSGLPVALSRSTNPVQPATLCLVASGGGFKTHSSETAIMHTQVQNSPAIPSVSVVKNHAITTSKDVAAFFGKRHDNIIRAIENFKSDLDADFYALNFEEIQNQVDLGMGRTRLDRGFNITKDGFTLLVMGFTGKQAMQFKIAYINRFNELEAALRSPLALTDGQHFVVAKDGVVIYHKPLSERTSRRYLQPRVIQQLPTPEYQQALKLLDQLQSAPAMTGDVDYRQVQDALRRLLALLGRVEPYRRVAPAIVTLEAADRLLTRLWTMIDESRFRISMVQNNATAGQPLTEGSLHTIQNIRHILGLPMTVRLHCQG